MEGVVAQVSEVIERMRSGFNRYRRMGRLAGRMSDVLRKILYDGTGDAKNSDKRLWPIRVRNYREALALLREYRKETGRGR